MSLKTRSGVKKRLKVTGSGKIKLGKACKRHLLSDKSKKAKGRNHYGLIVADVEVKRIKRQIPYNI